jgi:outer membrane protein assembly factor BamB
MPPILPTRRRFLAAAGASAAASIAGCASQSPTHGDYSEGVRFDEDWPTFRHDDANTAYDRDAAPPADRSTAWTSAFGVPSAGPTVADGVVLAPGDPLRAVEAATGEVRWTYDPGEGVRCAPAVVGDTAFVGTKDGRLAALDAAGGGWLSGPERWSLSLGRYVGNWLAVADGRAYAPVVPPRDEGGKTRLVAVE